MLLNWFKRFPARIAAAKMLSNYRDDRDNWEHKDVSFSLNDLGYKVNKDMAFYLQGDSNVKISNLDELCDWLINCEYERLPAAHEKESAYWQSPLVFEEKCKGNCVGSSLWAWRKLIELGYDAEFFVGDRIRCGDPRQHAWVMFKGEAGRKVLVETVSNDREHMLYYLDDIRQLYIPRASVDSNFKCKLYGGYCAAVIRNNKWMAD